MPDRADDLARRLVRVLPDGDGHLGIDVAGEWFDCATDDPADVQAAADDIATKLATALRAYAEEARREERKTCGCFLTSAADGTGWAIIKCTQHGAGPSS